MGASSSTTGDGGRIDDDDSDDDQSDNHLNTGPWKINREYLESTFKDKHIFLLLKIDDYTIIKNICLSLHTFKTISNFSITFFIFYENKQKTLNSEQRMEIQQLCSVRKFRYEQLSNDGFFLTHKHSLKQFVRQQQLIKFKRSKIFDDAQYIEFSLKNNDKLPVDYILNCTDKKLSLWLEATCDISAVTDNGGGSIYENDKWRAIIKQFVSCEATRQTFTWNPKCLLQASQTSINVVKIEESNFAKIVKLCNSCKLLKNFSNNILVFYLPTKYDTTKYDMYIKRCLKSTLNIIDSGSIGHFSLGRGTGVFYATAPMKKEAKENALEFSTKNVKIRFRNMENYSYDPKYLAGVNIISDNQINGDDFRILNPLQASKLESYFTNDTMLKNSYAVLVKSTAILEFTKKVKFQNVLLFSEPNDAMALLLTNSLLQGAYKHNIIAIFRDSKLTTDVIKKFFPTINQSIVLHLVVDYKDSKDEFRRLFIIVYKKNTNTTCEIFPSYNGEMIAIFSRYFNNQSHNEKFFIRYSSKKNTSALMKSLHDNSTEIVAKKKILKI